MKQHEVKSEKEINGVTFYIRPFPGWTSMEVHGELAASLLPLLAPIAGNNSEGDVLDIDISSFTKAMSSLSGKKLVTIFKSLITDHKNISVETESGVKLLDNDLSNEIFCGELQDMFILAWEVIRVNFPSIFEKAGSLFGSQKVTGMITALKSTGG